MSYTTVVPAEVAAASDRARWRSLRLPLALAVVLPVLTLLPFVNKAYHIDDTVYLYVAKKLQSTPWDFYGFDMNWRGKFEPLYETNENPPGVSYFLAIAGALFGFSEPAIHTALMIPAIALSVGVCLLAVQFKVSPYFAVAATAFSPVVWLSSTTAMSDISMVAWYVWAINFWVAGMRSRRTAWLGLAALCMSLSILTKYFGLSAIPLALAYGILQRRALGWWALWLLVPIAATALYGAYTSYLYGINLVTGAAEFATENSFTQGHFGLSQMVTLALAFFGGLHLIGLVAMPRLWRPRYVAAWSVAAVAAALFYTLIDGATPVLHPDKMSLFWWSHALFGVFVVGGVHVVALALSELYLKRDAETTLLALWILGTLAFAAFVNWSVNGRSILAAAPPLAILVTARLQRNAPAGEIGWKNYLMLVPVAAVALWITIADTEQANSSRKVAQSLAAIRADLPERLYYQGHFGFQYYMDAYGFEHVDFDETKLRIGDGYIVASNNNAALQTFEPDIARTMVRLQIPLDTWCAVHSLARGAGFYHHGFGPLPYVFGPIPPEVYYVHLVDPRGVSSQ